MKAALAVMAFALVADGSQAVGRIETSVDGLRWEVVRTIPVNAVGVEFPVALDGEPAFLRVIFPYRGCDGVRSE